MCIFAFGSLFYLLFCFDIALGTKRQSVHVSKNAKKPKNYRKKKRISDKDEKETKKYSEEEAATDEKKK